MIEEFETYCKEAVQLLRDMVAIPSVTFDEGKVCSFLFGWLTEKGLEPHRVGNNLICGAPADKNDAGLLLCAHIDTVSPGEDYSFDPFRPVDYAKVIDALRRENLDEEEIVAGLGSNDDGASAVALISAYRYFRNHPEESCGLNLMLALTCEEERSGEGGMRSLWSKCLSHNRYAIIGEPTGMMAATSERGLLVVDATAVGVSGHAARNEGVNSIYVAAEDIIRLRGYRFEKVSQRMGDVHLNVTQINAGTAHNVIPDRCHFVIDVRPTDVYTNVEILEQLQGICRSTLKARNLSNKSSSTYPGSPLERAAELCGIVTFSSPTTSDWMRIDCDAVKMGPGESSRSHKKDEYVLVKEIREGIGTYIEFIKTFGSVHAELG